MRSYLYVPGDASCTTWADGRMRRHADGTLLALVNINEREQRVGAYVVGQWLEGDVLRDLVSGEAVRLDGDLLLEPYRFVWLAEASQRDQTD